MHISTPPTQVCVVFNIHPYFAEFSVDCPPERVVAQDVVDAAYRVLETIHLSTAEFPDDEEIERSEGSLIVLRYISNLVCRII